MDHIYIQNLTLPILIGTLPHERIHPQNITINIEFSYDMRKAGNSDDLHDAVDYSAVEQRVTEVAMNSSFHLLEALAERIAQSVLEFPMIEHVKVRLEKPAAAIRAQAIALEIERNRK